jgi:hypothetical protein
MNLCEYLCHGCYPRREPRGARRETIIGDVELEDVDCDRSETKIGPENFQDPDTQLSAQEPEGSESQTRPVQIGPKIRQV